MSVTLFLFSPSAANLRNRPALRPASTLPLGWPSTSRAPSSIWFWLGYGSNCFSLDSARESGGVANFLYFFYFNCFRLGSRWKPDRRKRPSDCSNESTRNLVIQFKIPKLKKLQIKIILAIRIDDVSRVRRAHFVHHLRPPLVLSRSAVCARLGVVDQRRPRGRRHGRHAHHHVSLYNSGRASILVPSAQRR